MKMETIKVKFDVEASLNGINIRDLFMEYEASNHWWLNFVPFGARILAWWVQRKISTFIRMRKQMAEIMKGTEVQS